MFGSLFSGLPALYTANILLAINGVWCKKIPMDAISITAIRCIIAAFALGAFIQLSRTPWGFQSHKKLLLVMILGVLMGLHWSAFFYSMQVSTVAMGILALYSTPVITLLLEPLFDKSWPKTVDVALGATVVLGLAIMVDDWSLADGSTLGLLFGLASAGAFATRNVLQRRWLSQEAGSVSMAVQVAIAGLVCLPFLNIAQAEQLNAQQWGYVLALGLISTALAHTLIVVSLKKLPAKSVSLISCFQPILAIVFGWWLVQETPRATTWLGGAIILGCAIFETLRKKNE